MTNYYNIIITVFIGLIALYVIMIYVLDIKHSDISNYVNFIPAVKYEPTVQKFAKNMNILMPIINSGPSNETVLNMNNISTKPEIISAYNSDVEIEEDANFGNQHTEINKFIKSNNNLFTEINSNSNKCIQGDAWIKQGEAMFNKIKNTKVSEVRGIDEYDNDS